ncbi:TFIIB-type zinc ribbon-containing protein [Burkholderia multivorans]|uniref:TFIIB-type zinc ribbon-containing protein n=1 Tax=Burkholderia multivorans TaxID=87883 RepID=UPI001904EDC0|nr:zf-TFIIB domain-containing protein [Burkholderia multivorans]MBJ9624499.1 zf-TFIIB domain-containing protein [Burkholderia multivorans]
MKCPVCKTRDLLMAERQSIEIDYCPDCRGVWLDRGELDKLIARDSGDAPPPRHEARDDRRYDGRTYDDRRRHDDRRRRKSVFDLFDFD